MSPQSPKSWFLLLLMLFYNNLSQVVKSSGAPLSQGTYTEGTVTKHALWVQETPALVRPGPATPTLHDVAAHATSLPDRVRATHCFWLTGLLQGSRLDQGWEHRAGEDNATLP